MLAHCTATESAQQPLTVSAAQQRFSQKMDNGVRTVELAPDMQYSNILAWLGKNHAKNKLARASFQRVFTHAFRKSAEPFLQGADRIHFIYNGLTEAACFAAQRSSELDIPFIFTPNILDTAEVGSDWDSANFHHLYDRANELIALTEHEAQWLVARGVCQDKISVVPYGPILKSRDPTHEQGAAADLLSTRYVLFLGRLVPGKGSTILLKAFERLCAEDSTTQLIVAGTNRDHNSELIHRVNERLSSKRVHFLANVTQPLKTALLEEAAVLCVPSSSESLGGVYIEAMASKTPVIALDRPVSRCVIEHNKEGLLIAGDEDSLVNGLRCVLDNPDLAVKMGIAGRKKVDERFAWSVVTDKMLNVYAKADRRHGMLMHKAA